MQETSKSHFVREQENHYERFLRGKGLDIGAGNDPLKTPFGTTQPFDMIHGDANYMDDFNDQTFDFVYSSHCLEHMRSVQSALYNWCRILMIGGHLYFAVPDWEHYEKRRWPSRFNGDHKHSFSLTDTKEQVGRKNHHHIDNDVIPILEKNNMQIVHKELQLYNYDHNLPPHVDQTLGNALIQIVVVAQKIG